MGGGASTYARGVLSMEGLLCPRTQGVPARRAGRAALAAIQGKFNGEPLSGWWWLVAGWGLERGVGEEGERGGGGMQRGGRGSWMVVVGWWW